MSCCIIITCLFDCLSSDAVVCILFNIDLMLLSNAMPKFVHLFNEVMLVLVDVLLMSFLCYV